MGLESMSEPDDLDLDDEEGGREGDGVEVEVDAEGEADVNENDDEPFFDTQSVHSSQGRGSRGGRSGNKSEDVDTEDDPVGPITPGPGSKFEFVDRPEPGTAKPRLKESEEGVDSEGDDVDRGDGVGRGGFADDIEDDWADPLVLDSNPTSGRSKDTSPSPPSSSNVPPLAKSRPTAASSGSTKSLSAKSTSSSSSIPRVKMKSKKEKPVPVPGVVIPNSFSKQKVQEYYPFPVRPADEGASTTTPPDVAVAGKVRRRE